MPETIESARRWSGFVCPDCRYVFRVPRKHDGRGIVCPSCRRLLKIPLPDDVTPPLVVPLPPAEPIPGHVKRRLGRSRGRIEQDWENFDEEPPDSQQKSTSHMTWMLVLWSVIFAVTVVGVVKTMRGGGKVPAVSPPPVAELPPPPAEKAPDAPLSDAEFMTAAEPLAEKFLSATLVEDLLPLIRNPQSAEPRLRAMHPDGKIEAPGMSAFNPNGEVTRNGNAMTVNVITRALGVKPLAFFMSPDGLKIDWESWAGWSEMPWDEFLASRPVSGKLFRVWLSPVEYYNFAFSDDLEWQSYRIESPDGEHAVYGYTKRGTSLDSSVRPPPDVEKTAVTVMLSFPEGATSRDQVLVSGFVATGWTLETGEPP